MLLRKKQVSCICFLHFLYFIFGIRLNLLAWSDTTRKVPKTKLLESTYSSRNRKDSNSDSKSVTSCDPETNCADGTTRRDKDCSSLSILYEVSQDMEMN